MKAMSPSSMTMPTMSTWDSMYQQNGPPSHGPPPPRPLTAPGQPPPHNQQQRPPSTQGKISFWNFYVISTLQIVISTEDWKVNNILL